VAFELGGGGRDLRLTARRSGWLGWVSAGRVRVHVRVPGEFSVDVHTTGGQVSVEELRGDVEVRTSGAGVQVAEIAGRVDLHTSGGPIRADQVQGDVEARTSGGAIRLAEIRGRIDAETSGGALHAYDVTGPVRLRTSGGAIALRFTAAPAGEAETSGGPIEVAFPRGQGVRLDARTSGGRIELSDRIAVRGHVEAERVEAALNGGGDALRLRTSGGDIRVGER